MTLTWQYVTWCGPYSNIQPLLPKQLCSLLSSLFLHWIKQTQLHHHHIMSLTLSLSPFLSPPQNHLNFTFNFRPHPPKPTISSPSKSRFLPIVKAVSDNSEHLPLSPAKPRWENMLSTAASLYPLYVTVGGIVACLKPSTFAWFVNRGPTSYSLSLGLIMLAMGLTLELKDLLNLFIQRPISVSFSINNNDGLVYYIFVAYEH